ncbi:MAG TPA: hypothetical protein VIY49_01895 [Bryobacteraceae bacterium]
MYDAVIIQAMTMAEHDRHKGALDPEREEFLFLTVREMVADLGVETRTAAEEHSEERLPPPSKPERIVCFSANDEADEIAAVMLAQLLEHAGFATVSVPLASSAVSALSLIEPTANDVFCVSAIQPFAFSHARTLSRELRAKFPRTKTVVGVWGFSGDMDRALLRFQPSPPDKFVRSFAEALEYLEVPSPSAKSEVSD